MTLLAESAGRLLERMGNYAPRGMTVHDRTRLIGQLPLFLLFDRDYLTDLVRSFERFQTLIGGRVHAQRKGGQISAPLSTATS